VCIWTEKNGVFKLAKTLDFPEKVGESRKRGVARHEPVAQVWRVSWSVMGSILAVAQADNKVSMWKEARESAVAHDRRAVLIRARGSRRRMAATAQRDRRLELSARTRPVASWFCHGLRCRRR
jgi:hypothetical protein